MRSAALAVTAAAASSFASAQPLVSARQESSDTSDGWGPVLNGDEGASCAELAVIFARGTFDSGYDTNYFSPHLSPSLRPLRGNRN